MVVRKEIVFGVAQTMSHAGGVGVGMGRPGLESEDVERDQNESGQEGHQKQDNDREDQVFFFVHGFHVVERI